MKSYAQPTHPMKIDRDISLVMVLVGVLVMLPGCGCTTMSGYPPASAYTINPTDYEGVCRPFECGYVPPVLSYEFLEKHGTLEQHEA